MPALAQEKGRRWVKVYDETRAGQGRVLIELDTASFRKAGGTVMADLRTTRIKPDETYRYLKRSLYGCASREWIDRIASAQSEGESMWARDALWPGPSVWERNYEDIPPLAQYAAKACRDAPALDRPLWTVAAIDDEAAELLDVSSIEALDGLRMLSMARVPVSKDPKDGVRFWGTVREYERTVYRADCRKGTWAAAERWLRVLESGRWKEVPQVARGPAPAPSPPSSERQRQALAFACAFPL